MIISGKEKILEIKWITRDRDISKKLWTNIEMPNFQFFVSYKTIQKQAQIAIAKIS